MTEPQKIQPTDDKREMICPFCGYRCSTRRIGLVLCGPHQLSDGSYWPAMYMREVERLLDVAAAEAQPRDGRGA